MAYNPGVSMRGDLVGQGISQAGQSIAQAYGTGLQLKEEQKRYDDIMKQRRRDRKQLKKSYAIQAELLGVEKDDVETMGLGELQGFVEGTRMKQSFDYQALQLQELENNIAQTGAGKKALGQMQMYVTEQNLDPIEAATMAATDHGLELGEAAKLVNYATTGQKLGLELRTIEAREGALRLQESGQKISERIAGVQERQVSVQERELDERKNPTPPKAQDVEGAPGYKVVDMGGGRRQLVAPVETEDDTDPQVARQTDAIQKKVKSAYEEADQIATGGGENPVGGDERTGWGGNRYERLGETFAELRQLNASHRATKGKDHPQYTGFIESMVPLVAHMRTQNRSADDLKKILVAIGIHSTIQQMRNEGRDKDAKALAAKFGIDLSR